MAADWMPPRAYSRFQSPPFPVRFVDAETSAPVNPPKGLHKPPSPGAVAQITGIEQDVAVISQGPFPGTDLMDAIPQGAFVNPLSVQHKIPGVAVGDDADGGETPLFRKMSRDLPDRIHARRKPHHLGPLGQLRHDNFRIPDRRVDEHHLGCRAGITRGHIPECPAVKTENQCKQQAHHEIDHPFYTHFFISI